MKQRDQERINAIQRAECIIRYYEDVRENYDFRRKEMDRRLAPLLEISQKLDSDYEQADQLIADAKHLLSQRKKAVTHGSKLDRLISLRRAALRLEASFEDREIEEDIIQDMGR